MGFIQGTHRPSSTAIVVGSRNMVAPGELGASRGGQLI